jgi:hypothetical protein
MSKPVAKDLDEEEAFREVIDALRADNGRLLRLLIAGFVSEGRPEADAPLMKKPRRREIIRGFIPFSGPGSEWLWGKPPGPRRKTWLATGRFH